MLYSNQPYPLLSGFVFHSPRCHTLFYAMLFHQSTSSDTDMFGVNDLEGDEVIVETEVDHEVAVETEVAYKDVNLSVDEVTLAQALVALKSAKPKADKVMLQELEQVKAFKRVNTFVDYITELMEESFKKAEVMEESSKKAKADIAQKSSSNRAGEALEQENSKKQKVEKDKESKELKQCLEIILDDGDDVTIDATPLSTKSPTIMYLTLGKMLKNFNREDLEVLWSIVKARFKKIEPVNYMDNFLLLNLKTMFEHHVKDSSILYYLLVEKMYLLTNHTLHQMFNDVKLQVDYKCEMAFELLRLVKKQLKEGYGRIVGIKRLHDVLEVTAAKGGNNDVAMEELELQDVGYPIRIQDVTGPRLL
ncbi:hypothetical protein Tco_0117495 [Tanacetum coccineum]